MGRRRTASWLLRDTHFRNLQVDLEALEEVHKALGVAGHQCRRQLPPVVCASEPFPLRLELIPPRHFRSWALPHDLECNVLVLLRERIVLVHFQVGVIELDVLVSGVRTSRFIWE